MLTLITFVLRINFLLFNLTFVNLLKSISLNLLNQMLSKIELRLRLKSLKYKKEHLKIYWIKKNNSLNKIMLKLNKLMLKIINFFNNVKLLLLLN